MQEASGKPRQAMVEIGCVGSWKANGQQYLHPINFRGRWQKQSRTLEEENARFRQMLRKYHCRQQAIDIVSFDQIRAMSSPFHQFFVLSHRGSI